jgi:hypothetical protein
VISAGKSLLWVTTLLVVAMTILGSVWLDHEGTAKVLVWTATRNLGAYSLLTPADTAVVSRPRQFKSAVRSQYSSMPVLSGPVAAGTVIKHSETIASAATARPGDLIIRLPLSPSSPARALIRPGIFVTLLVSPSQGDERTTGDVLHQILVLSVDSDAIALSIPSRFGPTLATLGTERFTIAVTAH